MSTLVLFSLGKYKKFRHQDPITWLSENTQDDKYYCILSNKKCENDQYMGISVEYKGNIENPVLIVGDNDKQLKHLKKLYLDVEAFFNKTINLYGMSDIEKRTIGDLVCELPENFSWLRNRYLYGLKIFDINTADFGWVTKEIGESEVVADEENTPKYLIGAWDNGFSQSNMQWITAKECEGTAGDLVRVVKRVEELRSL